AVRVEHVAQAIRRTRRFANLQVKRLAQTPERAGTVLVLRPAFLGDDDQAAGWMPDADSGARLVAFLATRSAGPIGVDFALREQLRITEVGPRCTRLRHCPSAGLRPAEFLILTRGVGPANCSPPGQRHPL